MLYICATPIGNLEDISLRALKILGIADIILCEDTRNSQKLLNHHGITNKKLVALHEHNENEISMQVIKWLEEDKLIVQISDAGTPGISDPGARLCNIIRKYGHNPSPLPGASAFTSLLSVAGLIDTPFMFYGFLPNKTQQRQKQLKIWQQADYAIGIYESPHRIIDCLKDIQSTLGNETTIVMGRELTKQFETIKKDQINNLLDFVMDDSNQQRGEFVLIILPATSDNTNTEDLTPQQISALELIATELPAKKAVNLCHKLTGGNKELMYQYLLKQKTS